MTDTWHAEPTLLARLATDPAEVDPTTAASAEQHLVTCAHCRAVLAEAVPRPDLELLWSEIADAVDRQPTGWTARTLGRVGLGGTRARLVVATADLRAAAVAATAAITVGALVAAGRATSPGPFLAVAPLVVLGTIAVCFRPAREPAGEAAVPTPVFGFHLFLLRALVVLGATVIPLAAASLLLPASPVDSLAWVLPTLGLVLVALSLAPRVAPSTVALGLGALWAFGLWLHVQLTRAAPTVEDLASPAVQLASSVIAVAALIHLWATRHDLDRFPDPSGGLSS